MKKLNKYSQKAERFISAYWSSENVTLEQCYKTHSNNKQRAYIWCYRQMIAEGGTRFRIISYNSMQFTCGWIDKHGNLRIETKDSSYIIEKIVLPF